MNKSNAEEIAKRIRLISPYIRFAGIIDKNGKLLAYERRPSLKPLLDPENTKQQFSHIAIRSGMEAQFDKQLGEVQFVWEERKKAQTISFALGKERVWISIDKNVVRSEILRIIDECFLIVKPHS